MSKKLADYDIDDLATVGLFAVVLGPIGALIGVALNDMGGKPACGDGLFEDSGDGHCKNCGRLKNHHEDG